MDRNSPSARDLEHKLILASVCKYLEDYLGSPSFGRGGAQSDEGLTVVLDLLRESSRLDRETQQKLGQIDLRSNAQQYLRSFQTSLAGLKNFYQAYLATIPTASAEVKKQAEEHKERGNQLVSAGNEKDAIAEYNKAIDLDRKNTVYYCNRAAAYTGLNKFDEAIYDCHLSLAADPKYVKAFGRLGVACLKADRLTEAKRATERALEFDPENERYKSNLVLIEERMQQQPNSDSTNNKSSNSAGGGGASNRTGGDAQTGANQSSQRPTTGSGGGAGSGGGGGGFAFDPSMISGMLSNPQFMNMAQQVMGDPRIQQAMGSVAAQLGGAFQNQQQPQSQQTTSQNQQQHQQNAASGGGGASGGSSTASQPSADDPGATGGAGAGGGFNLNNLLGNLSSQLFSGDSDLTRNLWQAAQQAAGSRTGTQDQQGGTNADANNNNNNASEGNKDDKKDDSKRDDKNKKDGDGRGGGGSGHDYFS